MPSTAKNTRTAAQLSALRRYAMTWAWDQAYHAMSYTTPGTRKLVDVFRSLLARGWHEARLAEKHGHLVVREAAAPQPAPAARAVAFVRAEIADLENRDRLGIFGLARLSALRVELHAAEVLSH